MLLQSSNKLVQEYPEFLSDSPGVVVIGQMRIWHVHIFTSVERTENISVISTHKQEVQLTPVPYLRRPHGEGRGVTKTKTTIIIIITIILWSGAERVVILIRESDIEGIMLPFKPALCLHRNMSVSPEGRLKASWRPTGVMSRFTIYSGFYQQLDLGAVCSSRGRDHWFTRSDLTAMSSVLSVCGKHH